MKPPPYANARTHVTRIGPQRQPLLQTASSTVGVPDCRSSREGFPGGLPCQAWLQCARGRSERHTSDKHFTHITALSCHSHGKRLRGPACQSHCGVPTFPPPPICSLATTREEAQPSHAPSMRSTGRPQHAAPQPRPQTEEVASLPLHGSADTCGSAALALRGGAAAR